MGRSRVRTSPVSTDGSIAPRIAPPAASSSSSGGTRGSGIGVHGTTGVMSGPTTIPLLTLTRKKRSAIRSTSPATWVEKSVTTRRTHSPVGGRPRRTWALGGATSRARNGMGNGPSTSAWTGTYSATTERMHVDGSVLTTSPPAPVIVTVWLASGIGQPWAVTPAVVVGVGSAPIGGGRVPPVAVPGSLPSRAIPGATTASPSVDPIQTIGSSSPWIGGQPRNGPVVGSGPTVGRTVATGRVGEASATSVAVAAAVAWEGSGANPLPASPIPAATTRTVTAATATSWNRSRRRPVPSSTGRIGASSRSSLIAPSPAGRRCRRTGRPRGSRSR